MGREDERGGASSRRIVVSITLATAIVVADQLTKALIVARFGPNQPRHGRGIAGDFLALEYAENRGIAFGFLQGQTVLILLLVVGVLVGFAREFRRWASVSPLVVIGGGAILGGASGNLIDRVRLGYVVDFVHFGPIPNFNLADSAITIGAALIGWHYLLRDLQQPADVSETPAHHGAGRSDSMMFSSDGD